MSNSQEDNQVLSAFTPKDLKLLGKTKLKRVTYSRSPDIKYELDGKTLPEAIEFLKNKADEIEDKTATIEVTYGYDDCTDVELKYTHTETDDEYIRRLRGVIDWVKAQKTRVEDVKKNKTKSEKAQLKRLMKKYGVEKK